jgi:hypothetical protein
MKMEEGAKVIDFIQFMKDMITKLTLVGKVIDEVEVVHVVLNAFLSNLELFI